MATAILSCQTKKCNICLQEKPITDFNKQKSGKFGVRSHCKMCQVGYSKRWPVTEERKKANYLANLEKEKIRWSSINRSEQKKQYYARNKDKIIQNVLEHAKKHPELYAAAAMKRIATKRKATPLWANLSKISEIYAVASRKTKESGKKWHVDHIVPLQGKLVCGLHVEWNLEVIPATDNAAKGNRYWPDMP